MIIFLEIISLTFQCIIYIHILTVNSTKENVYSSTIRSFCLLKGGHSYVKTSLLIGPPFIWAVSVSVVIYILCNILLLIKVIWLIALFDKRSPDRLPIRCVHSVLHSEKTSQ